MSTMKIRVRRVGNSLGVLLPKALLDAWGIAEGDELELTERGIHPPGRRGYSHQDLDDLRLSVSMAVIRRRTAREIRAKILGNLHRWKKQGSWVSAYDEWSDIARSEDDGALFAAMLGRDENAVRLRQSMPYVGLLPQQEVKRLYEEAAG
jgi:bifunctional DNA-binding transcriptional regulator/antitoxin component of YhaV-PrlF toxin-antitoxin module